MLKMKNPAGRVPQHICGLSPYDAQRQQCRIRLDGNESPFSLPEKLRDRISAAVKRAEFNRYPDPDCGRLRREISRQTGFPPSGIVFGNGSDELIQMIIQTFCGDSETVLVPSPTFSMYALTALVLGRKVVRKKLDANFDLDGEAMSRSAVSHNSDVVFLASPNSPTGNLFSRSALESVISSAPGIVVVDEAYFSFSGETCLPLADKYHNLAVMRTFSKTGFAAIRLGVLFMRPELAAQISKARLPYNINSLTQEVALIALEHPEIFEENVREITAERERMFVSLQSVKGIQVFPSRANFLLVRFSGADAAHEVHRKLIEKSMLVRNFPDGDVADCLRITVGLAEENLEFEAALREIMRS